jgi:hypothetical protein
MTKRRNRRHKNTGGIKALLFTASVIATIGGARLLELQDPGQATNGSPGTTIVEPAANSSFNAPSQSGRAVTLDLKPITQAVVPRFNPVARAHSSR